MRQREIGDKALATNLTNPRRLQALAETCLVNSPPEDSFDRYTRLCSALLEVPVALVVLVEAERLFFKSRFTRIPLPSLGQSGPTAQSFCQHVIVNSGAFVVEDCRQDSRTMNSQAVTQFHIRAYAGLPIQTPEGEIVGSFCAIDFQPRTWSDKDLEQLADLRNGIESEIAMRLQLFRLDKTGAELRRHLRAAQQLFSNLGHEVRTPLNALVNLSAAMTDHGLSPEVDQLAQTVQQNAQRLSHLLEGILDLAAVEAGQVTCEAAATDVLALLESTQAMVTSLHREQLTLAIALDPEMPPWLNLDGRRLSQLLAILLQYHLGHSGWQGKLNLEAAWPGNDELEIRLSCDAYSLSLDELAALFSFNPAGVEASGLSPTIISSLVDLLSARLWSSCQQGQVSFHLRLPVSTAAPPVPKPSSKGCGLRILAIDDDTTNLCVLKFLAGKLGHELSTASSGTDGLSRLSEEAFDVLLLDLRMPLMDGFEVARQARQRGLTIPIVAVTADASEAAKQKAKACGMNSFMTKPVKRSELAEILDSLVPASSS